MGEQLEARKDEALTAVEEAIYGALKRADLLREVGPFLRQILALEALGAVLSVVRAESGQPSSVPSSPHETGCGTCRVEGCENRPHFPGGSMCLSHIREGLREAARAKAEAEFERDVEVQVEAMRRFATEQNREAVSRPSTKTSARDSLSSMGEERE